MKKALVVTNLRGFVVFLKNDIRLLQSMGYQVYYAANLGAAANQETMDYLASQGVTFCEMPFSSKNPFSKENIVAYKKLKALIKEHQFDFIHCHTPIAGFLTRLAARKARRRGTKVVYTTHGLAFCSTTPKKQWFKFYWMEKIASLFCDTIITINQEDFASAKKLWCKDVRYIHGVGVDVAHYQGVDIDKETYKQQVGIPLDKTIVLSVGELSDRKNHQIIIKALATLPNKDDYVYVICGRELTGSGFAQKLQDMAERLGVHLYLMGHRPDIPEITRCADIGAIPSVREGLGLSGVQCLAAGVPLVGTAVQGIKDYVVPGQTGFLYSPYDVEGYAEGIAFLTEASTREQMVKQCHEVAWQFDISVSHEEMKQIYESILADKN